MKRNACWNWVGLVCVAVCAMADDVKLWELPAGKDMGVESREGWKAGGEAGKFTLGAAVENEKLLLVVRPGEEGMTLYLKGQTGMRTELKPLAATGKPGAIRSVSAIKPKEEEKSVRVVMDNAEVTVTLEPGKTYVQTTPGSGAAALQVAAKSRYVVSPDFFAMDVVLDARRVKTDKATMLADNFYLTPLPGGDAIIFCVWPTAAPKEETREESSVDLFVSGEGEAREFSGSRVAFPGAKPVYVALLGGKNYWHAEDVSGSLDRKPVKLEWERPFEARWRASFLTQEGKRVPKWDVYVFSAYFPEQEKPGYYHDEMLNAGIKWVKGMPDGASQGLGHYVHPCWFKNKETYLYMAVPNVYEAAIIYPMQNAKQTPLDMITPVDVVRDTLGVGPCEYVLDKEGMQWAFHGGAKKMHFEGATCGLFERHVSPILSTWQKKGGKLDAEEEQKLLWLVEDMATFVTAVNERVHAYGGFLERVKGLCAAAKGQGANAAGLTKALQPHIQRMDGALRQIPAFDKGVKEWNEKMTAYAAAIKGAEAFDPGLKKIGDIRGFAERQDNTIAGCRRYVNLIRQEAGMTLAGNSTPEAVELAAKVREECRKVLRNPHPLEHF